MVEFKDYIDSTTIDALKSLKKTTQIVFYCTDLEFEKGVITSNFYALKNDNSEWLKLYSVEGEPEVACSTYRMVCEKSFNAPKAFDYKGNMFEKSVSSIVYSRKDQIDKIEVYEKKVVVKEDIDISLSYDNMILISTTEGKCMFKAGEDARSYIEYTEDESMIQKEIRNCTKRIEL